MGGAIVISALGDLNKVLEAMRELKGEWAQLYLDATKDLGVGPYPVPWNEYWSPDGVDNHQG